MIPNCTETISLLRALVFGAGDACVLISVPSILGLIVPFVAIVVALQWLARRVLLGPPARAARPERNAFPRTGQVLPSEQRLANGAARQDAASGEGEERRR